MESTSPCLWGQPPPSPNPRPHTREPRCSKNHHGPGPAAPAGSAPPARLPGPAAPLAASGLASSRCRNRPQTVTGKRRQVIAAIVRSVLRSPSPCAVCLPAKEPGTGRRGPAGESRGSTAVALRPGHSSSLRRPRGGQRTGLQGPAPGGRAGTAGLSAVSAALRARCAVQSPRPVPVPGRTFHT